jgi:hypothetical protein
MGTILFVVIRRHLSIRIWLFPGWVAPQGAVTVTLARQPTRPATTRMATVRAAHEPAYAWALARRPERSHPVRQVQSPGVRPDARSAVADFVRAGNRLLPCLPRHHVPPVGGPQASPDITAGIAADGHCGHLASPLAEGGAEPEGTWRPSRATPDLTLRREAVPRVGQAPAPASPTAARRRVVSA